MHTWFLNVFCKWQSMFMKFPPLMLNKIKRRKRKKSCLIVFFPPKGNKEGMKEIDRSSFENVIPWALKLSFFQNIMDNFFLEILVSSWTWPRLEVLIEKRPTLPCSQIAHWVAIKIGAAALKDGSSPFPELSYKEAPASGAIATPLQTLCWNKLQWVCNRCDNPYIWWKLSDNK